MPIKFLFNLIRLNKRIWIKDLSLKLFTVLLKVTYLLWLLFALYIYISLFLSLLEIQQKGCIQGEGKVCEPGLPAMSNNMIGLPSWIF